MLYNIMASLLFTQKLNISEAEVHLVIITAVYVFYSL